LREKKSMNKIIIANWKMYGTVESSKEFLNYISKNIFNTQTNLVVCLPYTLLWCAKNYWQAYNKNWLDFGAQNCHYNLQYGPFTGCINAFMLKDIGANYTIIGHSETRTTPEQNQIYLDNLSAQLQAIFEARLTPIICVNQNVWNLQAKHITEVDMLINYIGNKKAIIAYEPTWAINQEQAAPLTNIQHNIQNLKNKLNLPVLYGGSVNKQNANQIAPLCDGLLVGRLGTNQQKFCDLVNNIQS